MLNSMGHEVRTLCSTPWSMNFILLMNIEMQTLVGILTFISRINTSECFVCVDSLRPSQQFFSYVGTGLHDMG